MGVAPVFVARSPRLPSSTIQPDTHGGEGLRSVLLLAGLRSVLLLAGLRSVLLLAGLRRVLLLAGAAVRGAVTNLTPQA
jgi:hypothetical protein